MGAGLSGNTHSGFLHNFTVLVVGRSLAQASRLVKREDDVGVREHLRQPANDGFRGSPCSLKPVGEGGVSLAHVDFGHRPLGSPVVDSP